MTAVVASQLPVLSPAPLAYPSSARAGSFDSIQTLTDAIMLQVAAPTPQPVASTSAAPYHPPAPANAKGKQPAVPQQPVFVNLPNSAPRSYTILREVGDGSFGTVWLADWHSSLDLPPGTTPPGPSSRPEYKGKKLVAIKRMKKSFAGGWDECMKLKELKSLRTIPMHPNIIPLYDAFLMPTTKELYFVFECMEGNLYQLTKSRKGRPLSAGLTASIFRQILLGLDHIHAAGFFHRDMKPENLLITTTGLADYPPSAVLPAPGAPYEKDVVCSVKLADFGLAREIKSRPPYTEYVSTRWYRAPEVLLRARDYSTPVDLWALGTILAEMVNLKPLFPGQSEIDQVKRICQTLGDPATDYGRDPQGRTRGGGVWDKGLKLAKSVGFVWPKSLPANFPSLFDQSMVSQQLIDCIMGLLRYEPKARYSAKDCLEHAYFRDVAPRYLPLPEGALVLPATPTSATGIPLPVHVPQQMIPLASPPPTGPGPAAQTWYRQPSRASMQSMPESVNSDYQPQPWERASFVPSIRRPTAASSVDYYDGSIFEGIAPSRDLSLYNYEAASPTLVGSTAHFGGSSTTVYDDEYTRERQLSEAAHHQHQQAQAQQQAAQQASGKKGWSLGSVFNNSSQQQLQQQQQAATAPPSLKRSTSQRSVHEVPMAPAPPLGPADAKKAKKEAEKAAKEAERARREAAALAARERARAVMQKKNQLGAKADAYQLQPNPNPNDVPKGKLRPPVPQPYPLPKISEDPSRLVPFDPRWKARRRDDDDDVHSVSSTETRNSAERRYSVSSFATVDSDPGPRAHLPQPNGTRSRMTTSSSLGSTGGSLHRFHVAGHDLRPPSTSSTTGSFVDYHLAQNFQGLSAADGGPPWTGQTPYSSHGAPGSTEKSFTFNPAVHSLAAWQDQSQLRQRSQSPTASFHSLPPSLPSHHAHPSPLAPEPPPHPSSSSADMDSS